MATKIRKIIKTCKLFWPASEDFAYFKTLHCSFLLTAEEKEPKKTATPKPLHRGFSLFRGKTLYIKILVWLAKPVPYRASHGFGDYAQLVAILATANN